MSRVRVAVVGLGTAGSAVAALCAARGLDVVGLEAGPLDAAGARWVNGVPAWAFDEAGLPRPEGPELRSGPVPFHLVAGRGPDRVSVRSVLEVDMPRLTARLQRLARDAGADLRGGVRVRGGVKARGRDGGTLHTSEGPVRADVLVDASGLGGAGLLPRPRLAREHLCAAAQEVRRVRDRAAAEAFFAAHDVRPGEVLCFSGIAGGYSILNVRLDGDEVGLLTGTLPALGHPGGRALLDAFVGEQPWIGARISGGSRAIPLRRAWEVVGEGRVALVGDAACQVFAAHGSGVAMELLAARVLADTLADGGRPWDYNVAWQRRHGGLLAASDLFRRFSQGLRPEQIGAMMRRRVLSPAMMADTMAQRPARPPARALARAVRGMARLPDVAPRLLPVIGRMRLVEGHYRLYPGRRRLVGAWTRALDRLDPR